MNQERFDDLTRALATKRFSRGKVLKTFAVATVVGLLELHKSGVVEAKPKPPKDKKCKVDTECVFPNLPPEPGEHQGHCCKGTCIDTFYDRNNCGGCENACTGPNVCCAFGDSFGTCTDVRKDVENCGFCGNQCVWRNEGEVCSDIGSTFPRCTCVDSNGQPYRKSGVCCNYIIDEDGNRQCDSASCTDLSDDPNNCGECDNVCKAPKTKCVDSQCVACDEESCPPTQSWNKETCACECPSGRTECGNICCPSGQECCNGACKDTDNDPDNCRTCGNVCSSGVCELGVCQDPGCDPPCASGPPSCQSCEPVPDPVGGTIFKCVQKPCPGGQTLDSATCECNPECPAGLTAFTVQTDAPALGAMTASAAQATVVCCDQDLGEKPCGTSGTCCLPEQCDPSTGQCAGGGNCPPGLTPCGENCCSSCETCNQHAGVCEEKCGPPGCEYCDGGVCVTIEGAFSCGEFCCGPCQACDGDTCRICNFECETCVEGGGCAPRPDRQPCGGTCCSSCQACEDGTCRDCKPGCETCENGVCVPIPNVFACGETCCRNADEICDGGKCVSSSLLCPASVDCYAGEDPPTGNYRCPNGESCIKTVAGNCLCESPDRGCSVAETCSTSADCDSGIFGDNGLCVPVYPNPESSCGKPNGFCSCWDLGIRQICTGPH
jgi:hypothetical protein